MPIPPPLPAHPQAQPGGVAARGLGVGAVALGVASLPLFPYLGVGSLPVCGLGVLLGGVGLFIAFSRQGQGVGLPIAGTAVSGLALAFGIVWLALLAPAADRQAERDPEEQPPTPEEVRPVTRPVAEAAGPDLPPDASWAPPDQAVTRGDVQVRITRAAIGKVPLRVITRDTLSRDDLLAVRLELLNTDPTKKVEYHSWAGKAHSPSPDYATLTDNFGNRCKRVHFGVETSPAGAVERSEQLRPDRPVTDVLVFEVPLETATHLDLKLPAKSCGAEGAFLFRIPMKSVHGSKAAREEAAAQERAALEKAALEAEKVRAEAEKSRAEAEERQKAEAARREEAAEKVRQKAEEERTRVRSVEEVYKNSSRLKGSVVTLQGAAYCKVFESGGGRFVFYDPATGKDRISAAITEVGKGWKLPLGETAADAKIQGQVHATIKGGTVLLMKDCVILAVTEAPAKK